jgi:short-subunit dehydrogenase
MPGLDLSEATAIVTGASRGIGPYIAAALARRGVRLALTARDEADLGAVAGELRRAGATVVAIVADITSASDRHALVEAAQRDLGAVDVLVNNAGGDPQRRFHDLGEDELRAVLELNLTAPVLLSRLLLAGMLERGRGHVVNVSSMAGRTGFPTTEAYAAAKDGLIGFTRVLRADYRRSGVSASTLILGPVRDAGAGRRTADEVGLKLPPKAMMASPQAVARAAVRAIARDRAEVVVMPGPGRTLRALMDRFPGLGPALNRLAGAEATMLKVADHRELAARARLELTRGG